MARGGHRPGAGRKPKQKPDIPLPEEHAESKKKVIDIIAECAPSVAEQMIKAALGEIKEVRTTKKGVEYIYSVPPDVKAQQYVIDRLLGKIPEPPKQVNVDARVEWEIITDTRKGRRLKIEKPKMISLSDGNIIEGEIIGREGENEESTED